MTSCQKGDIEKTNIWMEDVFYLSKYLELVIMSVLVLGRFYVRFILPQSNDKINDFIEKGRHIENPLWSSWVELY